MTRIGGMIAAASHGTSKKSGKPYCMVTLEDLDGSVQLLVMNEYEKFRPLLEVNKAILVEGEVSTGEDKPKIFPQNIMPLEDAPKKYTKQVHLRLNSAHLQPADVERARELTAAYPGKIPLFLCFQRPDGSSVYIGAHERFGVAPSLDLERAVNHQFGEKTYYAKVDASLPEKPRRAWEKKNGGAGTNGDE
jgi:DNA polymerase-3 subunit alpha